MVLPGRPAARKLLGGRESSRPFLLSMPRKSDKTMLEVDGRVLEISNLDKVMYPGNGFTKAHVIDYYTRVAAFLLPHIKDRPVTLKRFPDGVTGEFFYEKDAPSFTPAWIKT